MELLMERILLRGVETKGELRRGLLLPPGSAAWLRSHPSGTGDSLFLTALHKHSYF